MTKQFSNYSDLLTFTRASKGHALRPVSYGDELVDNGDFATDSDWTGVNSTLTVVDGQLNVTDAGGYASARQAITTKIGSVYKIEIEIINGANINLDVYNGEDFTATPPDIIIASGLGVNSYVYSFVAEATTSTISLRGNSGNGTVYKFDNVSVKEVTFDESDGTLTLFEHPNNVPRVEWDADRNRLGLLVEEARTNLVTYSEDFSQWTATGVTVTKATITSPDGNESAYKLTSSGSGTQRIRSNTSATGAASHSIFAKKDTASFLQLLDGGDGQHFVNFDLENGTVGTSGTKATGAIEEYPSGWYRCTMITDGTANTTNVTVYITSSSSANYGVSTTAVESFYIYGAQLEAGSFPTSYMKTSGNTASRSADVASIPVADFGYNADEGTLFAELRAEDTSSTTGHTFYSLKKDTSNYVRLDRYSAGFALRVRDGGTYSVQAQIPGGEPNTTDLHKVSAAYKANDFAYVYNGGTVGTDTSGTIPDGITTLHLSEGDFNGHIKKLMYIPRRLTNAQLVDLTS